jgi:WD40 repeat protein
MQARLQARFLCGSVITVLGTAFWAEAQEGPAVIKPAAVVDWQSEQIGALAFTSDGKTLVVAPKDPDCWLVDPQTGKKRGDIKAMRGPSTAIFTGPKPNQIYCVESIIIRLVNLETSKDDAVHSAGIGKYNQGVLSPQRDVLVTASVGVEFIAANLSRSLETLTYPDTPKTNDDFVCTTAAFEPAGKFVAGAKPSGKVYLWSMDGLKSTAVKTIEAHAGRVDGLAFTPAGLVSLGRDGKLNWWGADGAELASHALGSPLERGWLLAGGQAAAVVRKPHDGTLQLYRLSEKPTDPPTLVANVSFVALFDGFPTINREFSVTALDLASDHSRLALAAQSGSVGLSITKAGLFDVTAVMPKPEVLTTGIAGKPPAGKTTGKSLPKSAEPAEVRTWTSADGKFTVEARFLGLVGASIRLERKDTGKVVVVPLRQFSPDDQAYVRERK